jgi:transcriptional regulator with XRE-family HTH domain
MTVAFKSDLSKEENVKLRKVFTKHLADRLREIRKSKNLSQQEVSEKAGLHLTYLNHLEAGKYRPSAYVLWKIAQVLQTSLDDLFSK